MATTKRATEAAEPVETVQADNSAQATEKAQETGNAAATEAQNAVTYTAAEFARAAGTVFTEAYSQDIVTAAFKMAGRTKATKAEAAEIVGKFLKKEVKVR